MSCNCEKNLEEDHWSDPTKSRKEFQDRLEDLLDIKTLKDMDKSISLVISDARKEGFDLDDIKEYFVMKTDEQLAKLPKIKSAYNSIDENLEEKEADEEMSQLAESTNYFLRD